MGMNAQDRDQETPLHLASYHGHADVAEVLLDHGARASAEDIQGQTPLHQVILGNHDYHSFTGSWRRKSHLGRAVRPAQRLMERGADVNAQNKYQDRIRTPPFSRASSNNPLAMPDRDKYEGNENLHIVSMFLPTSTDMSF